MPNTHSWSAQDMLAALQLVFPGDDVALPTGRGEYCRICFQLARGVCRPVPELEAQMDCRRVFSLLFVTSHRLLYRSAGILPSPGQQHVEPTTTTRLRPVHTEGFPSSSLQHRTTSPRVDPYMKPDRHSAEWSRIACRYHGVYRQPPDDVQPCRRRKVYPRCPRL